MKTILQYKYILLLVILASALIILYVNGKKEIQHEIYINVSTEKVFSILMDTDNYYIWNPMLKIVDGELKEGNKVTYQYIFDPKNTFEKTVDVKKIIPATLINQTSGIPLIFSSNLKYIIEKNVIGTKLTIREDYRGIGANFKNPTETAIAYSKFASALEQYAESK